MDMQLIGTDAELSAVESRALRTALHLERRHLGAVAEAARLSLSHPATTSNVTIWEKAQGYPPALNETLLKLDRAVETMTELLIQDAEDHPSGIVVTLRRPRGARRVHQMLALHNNGLEWPPEVVGMMDAEGGDFWARLTDAAMTRALVHLNGSGFTVRIVMDREYDPVT